LEVLTIRATYDINRGLRHGEKKITDTTLQDPVALEKTAMRRHQRERRDAMPTGLRAAASTVIAERLRTCPAVADAQALLLTLPFGSEWSSDELASWQLARNRLLVLPRVAKGETLLRLHVVSDLARDLAPGPWGMREPSATCAPWPASALDCIIVPGLAFDDAGYRLGYGRGYFDRLLDAAPQAVALGAGFAVQRVSRVPRAPHDRPVHGWISEAGCEWWHQREHGTTWQR
jgi:5-formyltetrahydrofolate cyclo-ligase